MFVTRKPSFEDKASCKLNYNAFVLDGWRRFQWKGGLVVDGMERGFCPEKFTLFDSTIGKGE